MERRPEVEEARRAIAAFVEDEIVPREPTAFAAFDDALRHEVQPLAKDRGLWGPQLARELGGGGFTFWESAALFEEAGSSLLGPLALGIAAPDEGNCHLLERVADEAQRQRYLVPLASGEVRSCFAMSEPAPGVGSDPRAVLSKAVRVDGGWRLDGDKHFITGAEGANFAIVMARTGEEPGAGRDDVPRRRRQPGVERGRSLRHARRHHGGRALPDRAA